MGIKKERNGTLKSILKILLICRIQILERKGNEVTAGNWVILRKRFSLFEIFFFLFLVYFPILKGLNL